GQVPDRTRAPADPGDVADRHDRLRRLRAGLGAEPQHGRVAGRQAEDDEDARAEQPQHRDPLEHAPDQVLAHAGYSQWTATAPAVRSPPASRSNIAGSSVKWRRWVIAGAKTIRPAASPIRMSAQFRRRVKRTRCDG